MNKTEEAGNIRKLILEEAQRIVTQDRNREHGDPEDNFRTIAHLWNGYISNLVRLQQASSLHELLTPYDVALMMALMKIARLQGNKQHRDSWVDLAGYAACGAGIVLSNERPKEAQVNKPTTFYDRTLTPIA